LTGGGGDLVRGFVLLTGCVTGTSLGAAVLGVAGAAADGPRRPDSEDSMDVRSGSDFAGQIRDEGPARLADAAAHEIKSSSTNRIKRSVTAAPIE